MVELGVLVPYPEEGRDAKDQRRPSDLCQQTRAHTGHTSKSRSQPAEQSSSLKDKLAKAAFENRKCVLVSMFAE